MALVNELDFGLDNFNNQKVLNQAESITQILLNIFMLKPGQLPGLPHIGMNIKQYIYKTQDEINVDMIKNELRHQCSSLTPYIDMDKIQVLVLPYNNESILYISVPFSVLVEDAQNQSLLIGFKKKNSSNEITFNYKVTNLVA